MPRKNLNWGSPKCLAVVGALCLTVLLFVLFVPVRLTAEYDGVLHEYEQISNQRMKLTAYTLSGRTYEIQAFSKDRDSLEDTDVSVTLKWGLLHTKLEIRPVPIDHYKVYYNALHYE